MSAASLDRSDLIEKAARLVQRGDLKGALPRYVKLFEENPTDWTVANTLGDLYERVGRSDDAVAHFAALAERLAADGFTAKARALYRKILRIRPDNAIAKRCIDELDKGGGSASPFLKRVLETARAARETQPEPEPEIALRAVDVRPIAESIVLDLPPPIKPVAPPARVVPLTAPPPRVPPPTPQPAVVPPAPAPSREPQVVDEFAVAVAVADEARNRHDFADATAAIEGFLVLHPHHMPALEKLIDIGVDGRLDAELPRAQMRLAEACLDAERYQQAQDIALDLIDREPSSPRWRDLLERVCAAARDRRQWLRPFHFFDPQPTEPPPVVAPPSPVAAPPPVVAPPAPPPIVEPPPPVVTAPPAPAAPPPAPIETQVVEQPASVESVTELPPDLQEWSDPVQAFDDIRTMLLEDAAAAAEERFAEAARLVERGEMDQAIRALEEAMCAPHLRTPAGARLAGIYRDVGAPIEALACLEWVAEMPPASEESGHELAYQLALTLEALGQQAQALGVYRELLAEVGPGYRDVASRAHRLGAA